MGLADAPHLQKPKLFACCAAVPKEVVARKDGEGEGAEDGGHPRGFDSDGGG
jgi:hypothetical protein